MDYRLNALNDQLECKEQMVPDFPSLQYGQLSNGPLVFDSTAYYLANNIAEISYKTFQHINKRYIEGLIGSGAVSASELFYQNRDGHLLMHHELTFLFLAFARLELVSYFNGLLGEIMTNGVAYSDGFILSMAAERIPSDVLQQIIDERNNNGKA